MVKCSWELIKNLEARVMDLKHAGDLSEIIVKKFGKYMEQWKNDVVTPLMSKMAALAGDNSWTQWPK